MLPVARTSRGAITRRPSGRPRRRQDGASAASPPTETFHGQDQEAPRPWAATCRRCLRRLPMRMKASAPCSPKLKKPLWRRSSPRRPWRGRRVRRPLFGPVLRLGKNWSSGAANAATRSLPMKLRLELRYDAECGPYHENESNVKQQERTKVVNHHLEHNRPSTS